MVTIAVNGRRKPHGRNPNPLVRQRKCGLLAHGAGPQRVIRSDRVAFGAHLSRSECRRAAGDDERPLGAFQFGTDCLDGLQIDPGVLVELREIVDVREVDDAIRRPRSSPQTLDILEISAQHAGTRRAERPRRRVRSGQPDYFVSGGKQFGDHRGSDPSGCTSDEYAHENNLSVPGFAMSVAVITLHRDVSCCHH